MSELGTEEYKKALLQKLVEEAGEVGEASSDEEMMKEIGDVNEVILALISAFELDESEIEALRVMRKNERGGFEKHVFLESVVEPD